ncbi:MAG: hypothetical protein LBB54_01880 [Cellulomonadaceae bacterium]|jgi:hypothetical protein|nr:hypothetical protein [Cellulomonadaceae bacterium]
MAANTSHPNSPAPQLSTLLAPPPSQAPPLLIRPDAVGGTVAWNDLIRHQAIIPLVDNVATSAHRTITPALRAQALADYVAGSAVIAGPSAVWVYAGGPPPALVHLVHPHGTHRPEVWGAAEVRGAVGLHPDTIILGGIPVTSPLRTCADCAISQDIDAAVEAMVRLVAATGISLDMAAFRMECRHRVQGRNRARLAFRQAAQALAATTTATPPSVTTAAVTDSFSRL